MATATSKPAEVERARAPVWELVSRHKPPLYQNVLFAFAGHWNQVVGFRSGDNEYYETSAHDANSKIAEPYPKWWTEIPVVPHRFENIRRTDLRR